MGYYGAILSSNHGPCIQKPYRYLPYTSDYYLYMFNTVHRIKYMQFKSIKRANKSIIVNHINEEYKQPNKRELSDVPDPPVPCAEPEKILKWLSKAISRND
jgi:hypothetical protein